MNLIPDICKYNKEAQFIISKATEMFIQFHTEKAIQISTKINTIQSENDDNNNNNNDDNSMEQTQIIISGQHCFDAMQTDHKFNFLRAVSVKPSNNNIKNKRKKPNIKRGVKRKLESTEPPKSISPTHSNIHSVNGKKIKTSSPSKKKRKLNNNDSGKTVNNSHSTHIVNNGHYNVTQPHITYNNYMSGYPTNQYYQHQYYQQHQHQQGSNKAIGPIFHTT